MYEKKPEGFYIFKIIDNTIVLLSSFKSNNITNDHFILGSIISFNRIVKMDSFSKTPIKKLSIKKVSDNDILINRFLTKYIPEKITTIDLFFINYIVNTNYKNRKCMLIF